MKLSGRCRCWTSIASEATAGLPRHLRTRQSARAGVFAGFTASDTGEVLTVATAPEYRRMGAARALLGEFLANVPEEVETVALEVRQSNAAAIALYESFGFVKEGTRKRFYRDPVEDADILVKNMKESAE